MTATKTIIVERGDNLNDLAAKHLGSDLRWPELFEANYAIIRDTQIRQGAPRDKIGSPHLIYPGTSLVIPI